METFLNAVKAQAAALDRARAQPRFGTVTSVDPEKATARVLLQPEGVLSGWLPVASQWTGAGWGLFCPPSPGDQVLVLAQEGAAEHGIIVASVFSASSPPPALNAGELRLVHSTGTEIRLANDGTIHVAGPVAIAGNVTVSGDITASGQVADASGSLGRLRAHYNAHAHTDSRSGPTSIANPQD